MSGNGNGTEREQWGSRMGFMLAAAGSAVGLGNIWRFPYVTGKNGGAAFLIIYLAMVFCIGASVMLAEFAIGRASKRNSVGAFRKLKGGAWPIVGWLGLIVAFLILSYYAVIGGWTLAYIFKSFTGLMTAGGVEDVQNIFLTFIADPVQVIAAFFVFMALVVVVVYRGVGEGIEKYCKVLMPGLFIILIILMVRALTLPGAAEGVAFYLKPDFSKVTGTTVIDALGQAFYSLSLGMGILITYGSYISNDEDLPKSVATVTFLDTMVAFLSGLVIFPTVFAFGVDAGAGAGLSFIALPAVFSKMWGGPVWSALFFALLFIAALTSSVSLFEVVISYCMDELKWTRARSSWIMGIAIFLVGIPSALSNGAMDIKLFGMGFLDGLDWLCNNLLLTTCGILICIFAGWVVGDRMKKEVTNDGSRPFALLSPWTWILKVVAPAAILVIIYNGLK
ncbi:sodium-dependent transporter [Dethiosulfovibrio sp. F2B]|uniref:sodium-dependent transporter n=1 Tax=Dethiosulfovibrio faecalis TaxID=2720018 RepID=UPI001F482780|nr:sodium-dependent transporter [Dethiosulfovibrio faecalis]MCF4152246.1 sodium-dependent transporter [Dethiosulfovibrio faecalis]